jgi:hypothetical protein
MKKIYFIVLLLCGRFTLEAATSTNIPMIVNPLVIPAVSIEITTGRQTTCVGMMVSFTPTPINGGSSPTYQWQINGLNVATGLTYSSTTLANNDVVSCVMTSNDPTASPTTATSNLIAMRVIQYPNGIITNGATATFCGSGILTASPTAATQWKLNGADIAGATATTYNATVSGRYTAAITVQPGSCSVITSATVVTVNPLPTITLAAIPAILAGATSFTIPYTATTNLPTTYSISGTGITTVTDAALPNSPITVNLTAAASTNLSFTLTVKNANGCIFTSTGSVSVVQSITWTGAVSTDWNTPNNWSPSVVPMATNRITIPNVANKPVVLAGTMATCLSITISTDASLTINNGGTLTVLPTDERGTAIYINSKGTFTNNGTLSCTATGIIDMIALPDSTTFNNNGTATFSTPATDILLGGPNTRLNNSATGIINIQNGSGFRTLTGAARTGTIITNQGTINYSGGGVSIVLYTNYTFNNSGTIRVTQGSGLINEGGILNNLACGKIFISNTTNGLLNSVVGGLVTNDGLIVTHDFTNANGTFNNTGVTNRLPTTGTVTNTGNGAVSVRHNTYPIFTYGGTYSGIINGIFTDSLATISAGTFVAPRDFTPLATLPRGVQTLYVKITPSGGACSYVVPFSYNTLTSSVSKIDVEALGLQQNRPNPFSQATTIAFTLPETTKAVLTVYDITGRQVFRSNNDYKTGYNEVILNKSVFQTTGTYFYRLTTDKYVAVKKLQFVAE